MEKFKISTEGFDFYIMFDGRLIGRPMFRYRDAEAVCRWLNENSDIVDVMEKDGPSPMVDCTRGETGNAAGA